MRIQFYILDKTTFPNVRNRNAKYFFLLSSLFQKFFQRLMCNLRILKNILTGYPLLCYSNSILQMKEVYNGSQLEAEK